MSEPIYGGPETQAYTAQREREFAERQAEADKLRSNTFNVLELAGQPSPDQSVRYRSPPPMSDASKDEFAAYIRGWSDGAGAHAMRSEFTNHATLAAPYNEGYADGRKARNAAHVAASEKYGHKVSILRTPEKIGCDDECE